MKQQLSNKERVRYQNWRDGADERHWNKVNKQECYEKEKSEI